MEIKPSKDDQFLLMVYNNIEENFSNENFTVEDLAKKTALSRSMLHRKLTRLTGKSAIELISEKRLIYAKELLENDVATISEIAYKAGFSSPSYFTKVFKKHFNIAPGEVKKNTIKDKNTISVEKRFFKNRKKAMISCIILAAIISAGFILYHLNRNKLIEKSIAILPFGNLSSDIENQYFADGIVEDLLTRLSKIDGLKVISRTSSEVFREKKNKTIPEIAHILGVNYILEGSVQKDTDRIRINIQLIDAKNDNHILSEQYDRGVSEVFTLQSEIAGQIASELSFVLSDRQMNVLRHDKTKNLKAFELYQIGRFHSGKRWIDGYLKGNEYYEKAIAEDPDYGLAYAGLSDNYHLMSLQNWINPIEGKNKAIELAKQAMKLDPNLAEPHTVLGGLYTYIDYNWDKAEQEFLKAISLNPNYSTSHQYYSELLEITGENEKARTYINQAIKLDPCCFIIRYYSSLFYFYDGDYKEALAENKICQDLVKNHEWPVSLELRIHLAMNNKKGILESFKKLGKVFGEWTEAKVDSIYKSNGIVGLLRWRLNKGKWIYEYEKAQYYMILGEKDKALKTLHSGLINGSFDPLELNAPEYKKLSSIPEFINLRNLIGLKN